MAAGEKAGPGGATVALPGTCGELAQGTLDGTPCLVSCPIERYSVAEVYVREGAGWKAPPDVPKTVVALRACLAQLGRKDVGGRLRIQSELPRGRGYASSTADIGAALYALGLALQRPLIPVEVARLAVGVEPSDSTLFPGLALWDHRSGSFFQDLGPAPRLTVVVLDPGGEVDTIAFNQIDHREELRRLAPMHREAFGLLVEGLKRGDLRAVGEAATLSARAHRAILPNPLLEPALSLAKEMGALGVCRAHSGTLLGILLDVDEDILPDVLARVADRLRGSAAVFASPLVGGGPRLLRETNALCERVRQR